MSSSRRAIVVRTCSSMTTRPRVRSPYSATSETRAEMKKILSEIQTGAFAKEWILENQANRPVFNALRRQSAEHPVERVGRELRELAGREGLLGAEAHVGS